MLAIADIVPDCRPSSRSACLYELGLHLRTGSGGVHPLEAYREWLAEVGFQAPEIHELLDDFPLTLIIARSRASQCRVVRLSEAVIEVDHARG